MLVVTHDLGLAWNIADRIAVMYLGRIVELGTTEEVLADPQHPYTRALLSRRARDRADGAADPHGRDARPDQDPGGVPLPPALPAGRVGRGRAARDPRAVPDGGPASYGSSTARRRPRRRLPRGPASTSADAIVRRSRRGIAALLEPARVRGTSGGTGRRLRRRRASTTTSNASGSDRTSRRASCEHVASGHAMR